MPTPPAATTTTAPSCCSLSHGPALEFGGREVGESGVPAMGVVEPFDVLEDRCPRLGVGPKDGSIQQFALQGGEERLGDGIVKAIPARPHGRLNARLLTVLTERNARVLAALIGVMDDARIGMAIPE